VFIVGHRGDPTPTMERELRRRSAIDGMIRHMNADERLSRKRPFGAAADAMTTLLVGPPGTIYG
jgi:hypothetical protein